MLAAAFIDRSQQPCQQPPPRHPPRRPLVARFSLVTLSGSARASSAAKRKPQSCNEPRPLRRVRRVFLARNLPRGSTEDSVVLITESRVKTIPDTSALHRRSLNDNVHPSPSDRVGNDRRANPKFSRTIPRHGFREESTFSPNSAFSFPIFFFLFFLFFFFFFLSYRECACTSR